MPLELPDCAARLGRSGLDEWVGIRRASRLQKPALSAASGRLGAAYQAVVAVGPWPVAGGETAQRASPGKNPRSYAFVRVLCALLRVNVRSGVQPQGKSRGGGGAVADGG